VDGDVDVAVGVSGTPFVLQNLGDKAFVPSKGFNVDGIPAPIVAGDFNEDGLPDLAGNRAFGDVDILLNEYGPLSADCNTNSIPDECDIADGGSGDCNTNAVPDDCEAASIDCNTDGLLDPCEADCNTNGVPDRCDTGEDDQRTPQAAGRLDRFGDLADGVIDAGNHAAIGANGLTQRSGGFRCEGLFRVLGQGMGLRLKPRQRLRQCRGVVIQTPGQVDAQIFVQGFMPGRRIAWRVRILETNQEK